MHRHNLVSTTHIQMIVAYARTLGVVIEPEYFTTSHPDIVNLQYLAVQESNVHIYSGEPQVYQERTIQPVALNQSVPKSRHEIITEILVEYPDVNGREIERRTGIPATSANRTLKELKGKLK